MRLSIFGRKADSSSNEEKVEIRRQLGHMEDLHQKIETIRVLRRQMREAHRKICMEYLERDLQLRHAELLLAQKEFRNKFGEIIAIPILRKGINRSVHDQRKRIRDHEHSREVEIHLQPQKTA